MFPMHFLFVVDSGDISLQLLLRITIAFVVFGYPEMFDIRNLIALLDTKIGRVGFVCIKDRILVYRFVFIFYLIHI